MFEAPSDKPSLSLPYNQYTPDKKPLAEVHKHQQMLREVSRVASWVASDIGVHDNIVKLWLGGVDVEHQGLKPSQ